MKGPGFTPATAITWLALAAGVGGCGPHPRSVSPVIRQHPPPRKTNLPWIFLKNNYLYVVRDWCNLPRNIQKLLAGGVPAANRDQAGRVPSGTFYVNRDVTRLSPEQILAGPNPHAAPRGAMEVTKIKPAGVTQGFWGTDASGESFLVKLDHPDYPELSTSAEVIGQRFMWLLGYHVPDAYIVTLQCPDRRQYHGRRASASRRIPGEALGYLPFDRVRDRREMRALRVAGGWINDTDRVDYNTLLIWREGQLYAYLLDFNGSLGCQSGLPKEPYRGWRHTWDVQWQMRLVLSLGLWPLPYDVHARPVCPAVGLFDSRYDPRRWKTNIPNMAFDNLTDGDARWMTGRICALSVAQIRAAVAAGQLSNPADEDHVVQTLLQRREILRHTWPPKE